MKKFLRLIMLLAVALPLLGQQCAISFRFTAATSTSAFNNLTRGCVNWTATFNNTGFSALTFTVQTAPNSSGSPGAWSTFSAASGSNPSTAITQASATFSGYFPFVRVTLSGLTGSGVVTGLLYGSGSDYASAAGSASTVVGPDAPGAPSTANPVQVAGNDSTNVRAILTDTAGRTIVTGPAASGAASTQNPLLLGGILEGLATMLQISAAGFSGDNALFVAPSRNSSGAIQPLATDTSGGLRLSQGSTSGNDAQSNNYVGLVGAGGSQFEYVTRPMVYDGIAATLGRQRGSPLAGTTAGGYGSGAVGALYGMTACDSAAVINVAAAATTELVALTASRSVRVCSFTITADTAVSTAKFVQGTGANCGTGTADLTGAMAMGVASNVTVGSGLGEVFKTTAANALCLTAVTGTITGLVSYAKF